MLTTDAVVLSPSEVRALVLKAARGAGLHWGFAEEAGWAAEWLARRSLPAAPWATVWLGGAVSGRLGPVEVGVALADRLADGAGLTAPEPIPDGLEAPGYLLPFLHLIAAARGAQELVAGADRAARVEPDGTVLFGPAWSSVTSGWMIVQSRSRGDCTRLPVSVSVVECLEVLALRTTVPSSAASRQDAGACAPDND